MRTLEIAEMTSIHGGEPAYYACRVGLGVAAGMIGGAIALGGFGVAGFLVGRSLSMGTKKLCDMAFE